MIYETLPATEAHAEALALVMREEDAAEVLASSGHTPLEALLASMKMSRNPKTVLYDGRVLCMFGVGTQTLLSIIGVPWLLGSEEMPKHGWAIAKESKRHIEQMRREFRLVNYVDARYTAAVRWLRWLGFVVYPAEPFGTSQLPFHRIEMKG